MAQRRKLPPLTALRAFEAAARHLSFKEAADELCVTATAVSHQIRHLETLVGFKLFERTPRAISLTPAGVRLYPVLRDSFDRITAGVQELSVSSHHVRISVTPAFAAKVLVPALPAFHERHPQMQLEIDATDRVVDLRRGEADLAVRYGRDEHAPLQARPLVSDEYWVVASPSYAGDGVMSANAIHGSRLLRFLWKNAHLGGPTWSRWMTAAGIEAFDESRCLTFSDEHLAVQAALDGAGIALLSNVLVRRDLAQGRLVRLNPLALRGLTFAAVYAADNPKDDAIGTTIEWLKQLTSSAA